MAELEKDFTPSENTELPEDSIPEAELESEEADKDFLQLMDEYMPKVETLEVGEVREVPVLEIRPDCVLVDVGDKMEGLIDIAEFMTKKGEVTVSPGDLVEVMIEGRDDDSDQVVLSHKKAARKLAVDRIRKALDTHTPVRGYVQDVVKGGLIVDVGLLCFMPASQIDTSRVEDLTAWVGREIQAYVIDFDLGRRRAVISRRQLVAEDMEKRKAALMETIKEGEIRTVTIKSIHDFGAFADLGSMDGFIPREEISWERGSHPAMFLKEGQEMKAKVIRVDKAEGKVTLSRKQARIDPWDNVEKTHPVNATITGRVASIAKYGAFVQIEEGLTGMIHSSNLSWDKGPKDPQQFMKEGDVVTAVVLSLDKENRRMALGLKQISEDPWVAVEGRFSPGARVKGVVTKLTDFGAFVKLDDNIEGLVHVSNMTWDDQPGKPDKYLSVGQEVECLILNTSSEGRRISLGIKQLQKSPLQRFLDNHRIGDAIDGVVTRLTKFGAFVDLGDGIEGLMHVSEISSDRVDDPAQVLKTGEAIRVKLIKIANGGRRISLSRKALIKEEERKTMKEFMGTDVKGGVNVGDLLRKIDINIPKQ